MWRLRIADGGKNPYLYSTNNFVGRQTWEFDPEYGTPEERDEVEKARLHFWNHRHQVKASSDVLWRMQVSSSFVPQYYWICKLNQFSLEHEYVHIFSF